MRLLDERESIRIFLNDWYQRRYGYNIPVFVKRIKGNADQSLPAFTLYLGNSTSIRTGVEGSAGYRSWMITYRPDPRDDEYKGLALLENLEAGLKFQKAIPGYLVDFEYPLPFSRVYSRGDGGMIPSGSYEVCLQGVKYEGDDLTVDNYASKVQQVMVTNPSSCVTVLVENNNSRLLIEVPVFSAVDYMAVYVNDRLQAVEANDSFRQKSVILNNIATDTFQIIEISGINIIPDNRRVYVERANVQRLQSEFISGYEASEDKDEPFTNILMLFTQVNLYRLPEATETIRLVHTSGVDEENLIYRTVAVPPGIDRQ